MLAISLPLTSAMSAAEIRPAISAAKQPAASLSSLRAVADRVRDFNQGTLSKSSSLDCLEAAA